MSSVKILVCYHKKDVLLKDDILTPIHVGRALAKLRRNPVDPELKWMMENLIGDDTGDNISLKNDSYNELTAMYWAWKNYDVLGNPDYIGLMHYRRHFIFREGYSEVENVPEIDGSYYNYINYSQDVIDHLFDDCDLVAHIGHVSEVYAQYKDHHKLEDLDNALAILKKKYPAFSNAADAYIHMSDANLCNMFIMPRKLFFEYCSWIFDILSEFESENDLSEKRLFISERLTGIFIEHQRRSGLIVKPLSATFVQGRLHVCVALPHCDSDFRTAVTMASVIKHAEETTSVDFLILSEGEVDESPLCNLVGNYPNHSITFVDVKSVLASKGMDPSKFTFPEHYPLVVSEVTTKNKIVYLNERSLLFDDIGRFSVWCNNDEFAVLTIGNDVNNGGMRGEVYSLNASRLRKHGLIQKIGTCLGQTSLEIFAERESEQVHSFAKWSYFVTDVEKDGNLIYQKRRGDQRWGVWNHALLYYDKGMEPWNNIQGLYSVYWWELASALPSSIKFDCTEPIAVDLWREQSIIISRSKFASVGQAPSILPAPSSSPFSNRSRTSQKSEGLIRRTLGYCKRYGIKETIYRIIRELRGE